MKLLKDNALLITLTLAVIGAGASLMVISQKVYDTQKNVQQLDQELLAKQWDVRALKAELAYLSRPDRLEQISSAIAQSTFPTAGQSAIAPVSYHLSNDLPAGMSLLPPTKPASAVYHKAKAVKREPVKQAPAKQVAAAPVKAPKPEPQAKKSKGFNSLLDELGG